MTKQEAIDELRKHSRMVVAPEFAEEIAQAFGTNLEFLGIKPSKTENFHRINYRQEDAELESVSIYNLAARLCKDMTGQEVHSAMHGTGSYADDITYKACDWLEKEKVPR